MQNTPKIDTLCPVETPEGVHLHLRCAGVAARVLAGLLDFCAVFVLLWAMAVIAGLIGAVIGEMASAGTMLGFFVLTWFYPAACELMMDGQTFGKRLVGLRVVQASGVPVTWRNSITRSVLLSLDIVFCISLPIMMLSREFRRIGDFAADTMVVYATDTNSSRARKRSWPKGQPTRAGVFSADENRAVVAFAERFQTISPDRQRELAGIVAAGLECDRQQAVQVLYDHALFVQGIDK